MRELHPIIRHGAEANGVAARIRLAGRCDPIDLRHELNAAKRGRPLVFIDAEGAEVHLLNPAVVPELAFADVLVETHDSFIAGCTDLLLTRFAKTHNIETFVARPRVLSDYPQYFLPFLPRYFPKLVIDLMDERRTGVQRWLYMRTKALRTKNVRPR